MKENRYFYAIKIDNNNNILLNFTEIEDEDGSYIEIDDNIKLEQNNKVVDIEPFAEWLKIDFIGKIKEVLREKKDDWK